MPTPPLRTFRPWSTSPRGDGRNPRLVHETGSPQGTDLRQVAHRGHRYGTDKIRGHGGRRLPRRVARHPSDPYRGSLRPGYGPGSCTDPLVGDGTSKVSGADLVAQPETVPRPVRGGVHPGLLDVPTRTRSTGTCTSTSALGGTPTFRTGKVLSRRPSPPSRRLGGSRCTEFYFVLSKEKDNFPLMGVLGCPTPGGAVCPPDTPSAPKRSLRGRRVSGRSFQTGTPPRSVSSPHAGPSLRRDGSSGTDRDLSTRKTVQGLDHGQEVPPAVTTLRVPSTHRRHRPVGPPAPHRFPTWLRSLSVRRSATGPSRTRPEPL